MNLDDPEGYRGRRFVEDVISIPRKYVREWDEQPEDHYLPDLGDSGLDWEAPVYRGEISWVEELNDQLPNGRVRDFRQDRFNLDEWSPEEEHLVIRDRIRDGLKDESGNQVYSIRFYQIPAPISTQDNIRREINYLRKLFMAQEAIGEEEWLREPQLLMESGGEKTMLTDAEDASRVAEAYEDFRQRYPEIGFLVDFDRSVDPEGIAEELPEGTVEKVRGKDDEYEDILGEGYDISRSLTI